MWHAETEPKDDYILLLAKVEKIAFEVCRTLTLKKSLKMSFSSSQKGVNEPNFANFD